MIQPCHEISVEIPVPVRFHHRPHKYSSSEGEDRTFQCLLAVWYAVGDRLCEQPPGSVIELDRECLYLADYDGELVLFVTPDQILECSVAESTQFAIDEFENVDIGEFDQLRQQLEVWLANPVIAGQVSTHELAQAINDQRNSETAARPNWIFDGPA